MQVLFGHPLEPDPVQLPRGVHGHLVQEHHLLRRLVPDHAPGELDQLLARGRLHAVLDRHVGAHVLAVHLVADADDADQRDRRVLGERAFHLHRADVRAVVHDDLLLAPEEPQVAVVVGVREVPGVEPAVAQDLRRWRRGSPSSRSVWLRVRIHTRPTVAGRALVRRRRRARRCRSPRSGRPIDPCLIGPRRRVQRRQAHLGHAVALVDRGSRRDPRTRVRARATPCRHRRGTGAARRSRPR